MAAGTVEAFLQGRMNEARIDRNRDLLCAYRRRWEKRAPEIDLITGTYFGPITGVPVAQRLLASMLGEWGSLRQASVELLRHFGETPLGHHRIHGWARAPRGSVDPLRKPPIEDSS